MKKERVFFTAIKVMGKPIRVRFYKKDGKKVFFKATKTEVAKKREICQMCGQEVNQDKLIRQTIKTLKRQGFANLAKLLFKLNNK